MASRIILLFTLSLIASMTLPANANPHSQVKPREFNSDTITPASSSVLVLNTNGSSILSAILDSGAGYAYFGTAATPALVVKVRLSDFTTVANLTLGAGANAAGSASAAILDPIHEIAYFGTLNGQIAKVNLSTFAYDTLVQPGLGGISSAAIDPGSGFGYFGTSTGNILKMRLSDLTLNQTLTSTHSNTTITLPPGHSIDSAVIDTTNGYAYFGAAGCLLPITCTASPNFVVKVRLSDFSIVSEVDVGVDDVGIAGIDTPGGYVYFGGANIDARQITRFSLTDLSKRQVLAPAPDGVPSNFVLDPSRGIGYGVAQRSLALFRLSDFNQIAEEYLQNNIYNSRLSVLDPATGNSYFASSIYLFPTGEQSSITRISPSNLPSNDFSLEPSPSPVSFQEGGVVAAYIAVRSNGYAGTVSFSTFISSGYALEPMMHLLRTTVMLQTNGDNYTILAIAAPNQDLIPASDFTITVTGSGGTISRSISIEVSITSGSSRFVLIINPPAQTMNRYVNTNYTSLSGPNYSGIAIATHADFSGTINFTATIRPNLSNGPTVKVDPSSVTENLPKETYTGVSWVYVTANSTTTTGRYEVDVMATAGNETHTAQLCLLILPHGAVRYCLLSDPRSLILGPGQTRTTLITQYMPHPPFNASTYLGTVTMTSTVSGPSPTALQATLNPSTFPFQYSLPAPQQLETTLTVSASPTAAPGNYALQISATNGTITGAVDIPVTVTAAPVSSIPGVSPGDWARYTVSATWTSTPQGLPPIPQIAPYLGSYASTLRIGATLGNETAGILSTAYLNGTTNVQEITGNISEESGSLFPWIVGTDQSFNKTITEEFAGSPREVTVLNITRTNGIVTATGAWTWDRQTGILLDYQLTVQGTGNLGTINGRVHIAMIETNLWTSPSPVLTITSISPNPASTGDTVTVTFTVNSATQISSIAVVWGDGTIDYLNPASTSDTHGYLNTGAALSQTFTINVTASNLAGRGYTLAHETVNDRAPTFAINSVLPVSADAGQLVASNFTASDPDGTISLITVNWGDGSTPDLMVPMSSGSMCQRLDPYLNSNACTIPLGDLILARAQDPNTIANNTIIVFRPFSADPNYLVVHRIIKIIPAASSIFNQITFWTQRDANPVPDAWDTPNGGIPASQIVGVYLSTLGPRMGIPSSINGFDTHTYANTGNSQSETFTINAVVTDNSGAQSSQTIAKTINDKPPSVVINQISPSPALLGQSITLTFSATDPDGTIQSISINWGDGTTSFPASTATSDSHVYTTTSGTFTISLVATDNAGSKSQPSTRTVTINHVSSPAAPAQTILGMTPVFFYSLIAAAMIALAALTVVRVRSGRTLRVLYGEPVGSRQLSPSPLRVLGAAMTKQGPQAATVLSRVT